MGYFTLGPIIAISIIAGISFVLFLIGFYVTAVASRPQRVFAVVWTALTVSPVFVGIPLLFFR